VFILKPLFKKATAEVSELSVFAVATGDGSSTVLYSLDKSDKGQRGAAFLESLFPSLSFSDSASPDGESGTDLL